MAVGQGLLGGWRRRSGGYFSTLGGRILDPDTKVENLGLGDMSGVGEGRRVSGSGWRWGWDEWDEDCRP